VATAAPAEIVRLMVGREVDTAGRRERTAAGDVVLAVENLRTEKLAGVSFEVRRGEVLGIAGLVGSGRSELGTALFGLDRILGGTVHGGRVGLLPEDRGTQGLMPDMSVVENATMGAPPSRLGFLLAAGERRALEPVARRLALKCESADAAVSTLSGGNQQKVLFARWLLRDRRPDPRDRRRRQTGHLPRDRRAGRGGQRRAPGQLRAPRAAALRRPDSRAEQRAADGGI
jgi:ABC-type sugar transport system ATPase subunit